MVTSLRASALCLLFLLPPGFSHAQTSSSPADQHRQTLDRYCVSCHNQALKTAGLMLDQADLDNVGEDRQLWERVLTKLTLRAMPPVNVPRPHEHTYAELIHYLETELSRVAQSDPNPGSVTVHRLNRTEYANAIRDLLDMEIDASAYLPPDNSGDGFDNIAEVLSVSPLLMEQYLFAAGRISRLAIGPASMGAGSETHNVFETYLQNARASEDLPFGSRGGTVFRHRFPLDGEYTISIKLHRNIQGYIRGLQEQHLLDIRVDHERVGLLKIGGERHGRTGPTFTRTRDPHYAGDPGQVAYEFTADDELKVRFPAKAGTRLVGVTFLKKQAKPTGIMSPRMRLPDIEMYKGGDPAVARVTVTGPFDAQGPGATASREEIFVCYPTSLDEEEPCARTILSRLARRAYRGMVSEADINDLLALYRDGRRGADFESGIELALQNILIAPRFLFRIEQDPRHVAPGEVYPISELELASRLSFFLWSSIPDEELLSLAEQNRLRDPGVLDQQIERMMRDRRSSGFIHGFGEQLLALREVDNAVPNQDIFPDFDDELRDALKQETLLWFESLVRNDSSVMDLLDSDYTYVNERLARHYGIPDVYGSRFRRVDLDGFEERRGLLGKGSILIATSYNNRTSPVLRGKWVLERLLGMAPPPPPEDAFEFEVENDDGKALTMKESMERHRANPACSACHNLMDPIGFALENYDAVGSFRAVSNDIDTSGVLFDGSEFSTTTDFQRELFKYSDRIVESIAEKMLVYATGREMEYYDRTAIREVAGEISDQDYSWMALIRAVVDSRPFQYRRAQGQGHGTLSFTGKN